MIQSWAVRLPWNLLWRLRRFLVLVMLPWLHAAPNSVLVEVTTSGVALEVAAVTEFTSASMIFAASTENGLDVQAISLIARCNMPRILFSTTLASIRVFTAIFSTIWKVIFIELYPVRTCKSFFRWVQLKVCGRSYIRQVSSSFSLSSLMLMQGNFWNHG